MTAPARIGRRADDLRDVRLETGVAPYAEGSCLVSFGTTRVLCAASVEEGVPPWRKGQGAGWVTGEYAMLPRATQTRTRRERGSVGGRTQEIQRLIGRSLRATMDLAALGERTITLDCDVLLARGDVATQPVRELVAAVSVGIVGGEERLDLEYAEDVAADVDMNLVA